jgi:hypothetical protein
MAEKESSTPDNIIAKISPYYRNRAALKKRKVVDSVASWEFKLIYDSSSETLEPLYFWLLDFAKGTLFFNIEKLVDNFTSSPGSGHFSELMGKATRMQEEAMKIYGMVNTVIKSIINIIYDLKEFKMRLAMYDEAKSKDKKEAAMISLKQLWMDQIDVKKGAGSINMMAQQLNFVTLRDAFMYANSIDDVKKVDLNERVRRVLEARVLEFLEWKDRSEAELRKRYEIEKTYLRTQVNTVKMYSRWAKPYLIAAEQLRMKGEGSKSTNPDVINVFNTLYLQLTILGTKPFDVEGEVYQKNLPWNFMGLSRKGKIRPYFLCALIDFTFRGIPKNVSGGQHYAFGGRTDVTFRAYALNQEELDLLRYELGKADFDDAMSMISGMTDESLGQLQLDIDTFLEEKTDKKKEEAEKKAEQDVNPFAALLGFGTFFGKKEKEKEEKSEAEEKKEYKEKMEKLKKSIKSDNWAETLVRSRVELAAKKNTFPIYDVYKKAHGMASQPFTDYSTDFQGADPEIRKLSEIFKK